MASDEHGRRQGNISDLSVKLRARAMRRCVGAARYQDPDDRDRKKGRAQ
jgi:hypothetical protein